MFLRATFYAVDWTDRNGRQHHGRILGSQSEIRRALKDTGMSLIAMARIMDPEEIRELSLRSISNIIMGEDDIVQRTVSRRRAVRKAMVQANLKRAFA